MKTSTSVLVGFVLLAVIWLIMDENNPLAYFKFYRRWRKGGWGKTGSIVPFVPYAWLRVGVDCTERLDEDYR